jgi:hypothetical protein
MASFYTIIKSTGTGRKWLDDGRFRGKREIIEKGNVLFEMRNRQEVRKAGHVN